MISGAAPHRAQRRRELLHPHPPLLDARIGRSAARLLSLDERKRQQILAAKTRVAERLAANLQAFSIQ